MPKIQTIRANLSGAEKVLEKERAYLAELRAEYAASVSTAEDDQLEDLELQSSHYEAVVSRAEARVEALRRDLAKAAADAKNEAGNAAKVRADALLADVQAIFKSIAALSGQIVDAPEKCNRLIEAANEDRRLATINGVKPAPSPLVVPKNIEAIIEALRKLQRLPAFVWSDLYG